DILSESVGTFDVVLFLGVFYHLFDAPTLTRQISRCATDLLILETHQDALSLDRPAMIFYPGAILNGDETNWWGPNPHAVYELLKEIGFPRIFYQDHPLYGRHRGIYHAFRSDKAMARIISGPKEWRDLSDAAVRADLFKPI